MPVILNPTRHIVDVVDLIDSLGEGSKLVVHTETPSLESLMTAERIAARCPSAQVMVWLDELNGVADRPVIDNLREFGLTLLATRRIVDDRGDEHWRTSLPEDGWTRIARRLHERHIAQRDQNDMRPRSRDWDELPDFYRESNLRQICVSLRIAVEAGRTWIRPADDQPPMPLSADEIAAWSCVEHESWKEYYEGHGWTYGPRQEFADQEPRHDALLPWPEIDPIYRAGTMNGIESSYQLLSGLGFQPFPQSSVADIEQRRWRRVDRRGTVSAIQQETPWTWTTEAGDTMNGLAGDWCVTDGGRTWSITADDLRRTYRHLEDDRYERMGTALARPASAGEVVTTSEGIVTATDNSWVLQDDLGHLWVVPAEKFAKAYTDAANP